MAEPADGHCGILLKPAQKLHYVKHESKLGAFRAWK